jgi:hypothetical protein
MVPADLVALMSEILLLLNAELFQYAFWPKVTSVEALPLVPIRLRVTFITLTELLRFVALLKVIM